MDHAAARSLVAQELAALADLVDGADMTTAVPTCPGWDLTALVKHTGVVVRWAAQMLRDGLTERLDFRNVDRDLPADDTGWAAWLRATAALLDAQLAAHGEHDAVWTWGDGRTAGWWARRLVHEVAVHRADAANALGAPFVLDPATAVDGVDELLENLPAAARSFAPSVAELRGAGETLHFHATDADGEWMITMTPDGFTWGHGHGKGDVAARATAADLLLLAYGRLPATSERVQRFGDTELLDRWLRQSAL
jgi:uncharacterized protein (TIGR03083 family)